MRKLAAPTGQAPPQHVRLRNGDVVALAPVAASASDRHLAAHPEELERHGPHARDWCKHDLQWLCLWAIMDADSQAVDFNAQLDWLAGLLSARAYPLRSLADALDTLSQELAPTLPDAASDSALARNAFASDAARIRPLCDHQVATRAAPPSQDTWTARSASAREG